MKRDLSDWMPFFGDDFFESESVILMEPAAQALYMRALWRHWKYGSLPADREELSRLFPTFGKSFAKLWAQVSGCFQEVDGRLVNERCRAVRELQDERARKGRAGAEVANAKRERDASATRAKRERAASEKEKEREKEKESQKQEPPPAAGRARARGSAPQQVLVDWFCDRFQEERGTPFVTHALDFSKTADLLRKPGVSPPEWEARALRMLRSTVAFHYQAASPRHLADRWNEFAVEIVPLTTTQRRQAEADKFFDQLEAQESSRATA